VSFPSPFCISASPGVLLPSPLFFLRHAGLL
jgi:hypothetical protein